MNSNSRKEEENSAKFSLTSANSLFSSKSNDIFAGLDALEQKHTAYQKKQESSECLERAGVMKHDPVEDHEDEEIRDRRCYSSNSKDKDSHPYHQRNNRNRPPRSWKSDLHNRNGNVPRDDFRRPRHQPPNSKRVPDFKINPDKWTSYSLDDVPEKDLSEKSNTRAALDFLWERKSEKERQERLAAGLPVEEEKFESETAACSKGLISFSRKKQKDMKMDCDNEPKSAVVNPNLLRDAFSEQDNDIGSSTSTTDNSSMISSSKSRKSQMSESEADVSNSYNCGDEGQQTTAQTPTFKSRKNIRKQFRRRNNDNE